MKIIYNLIENNIIILINLLKDRKIKNDLLNKKLIKKLLKIQNNV